MPGKLGVGPTFLIGQCVESGEPGTDEYDTGLIVGLGLHEAQVKWRVSGDTYWESFEDIRLIQRPDAEPEDTHIPTPPSCGPFR